MSAAHDHRDQTGDRLAEEVFGVEDRSSWAPIDLLPVIENRNALESPPSILARSDGACLLYAAKIHFFAESPNRRRAG